MAGQRRRGDSDLTPSVLPPLEWAVSARSGPAGVKVRLELDTVHGTIVVDLEPRISYELGTALSQAGTDSMRGLEIVGGH